MIVAYTHELQSNSVLDENNMAPLHYEVWIQHYNRTVKETNKCIYVHT